ncbi:MAG: hypothetical protein BJ554DRAFT_93 [Olpidium bornovanus]|uniref:Uncharacterized protein n=1 Tax=Olpidium bornovanus TaxID=278681 RepID=A0A8H8A1K4_9FUNG|nr:MAG: hypothetical protein BJ554DRAFT_93 [Olpidium bornovanus]
MALPQRFPARGWQPGAALDPEGPWDDDEEEEPGGPAEAAAAAASSPPAYADVLPTYEQAVCCGRRCPRRPGLLPLVVRGSTRPKVISARRPASGRCVYSGSIPHVGGGVAGGGNFDTSLPPVPTAQAAAPPLRNRLAALAHAARVVFWAGREPGGGLQPGVVSSR